MDLRYAKTGVAACAALLTAAAATARPGDPPPPAPLLGFDAAGSAAQLALERRFDAGIDARDLRAWLQRMAAAPNHVGSPHDAANARFMRDLLRSWGWEADIETFQVLYPTPLRETVELVAPSHHAATLLEAPIPGDAGSAAPGALPAYNVYGADGDVTAGLVYVNYGMEADYRELARRGISVRGRIVIARYGGGWRGLKPKLAEQHGAVGCIIYSDPHEDGYGPGDPYPRGGWRPPQGIQRGSVADMPVYPGDPLTPGVGATGQVHRLDIAQATTLMRIPVVPIAWADARPMLQALSGPVAPAAWRGSLPLTYHLGPGPAKVHLAVKSQWTLKPVYDVIARIRGARYPDEWVIRGNHHDGWVDGAWDPLSGMVAELAEAKAIGGLLAGGWRPARTLVYASWDGEEPGLLGSTEWAEAHAAQLQQHAVLYLNSDENSRGFWDPGGSDALQHFTNEVGAAVRDPQTGVSVRERLRARLRVQAAEGAGGAQAQAAAAGGDLPLDPLGSGSDFSPFLQHLGIATLNIEYGGEADQEGVYHSRYDTFEHYVRFGDPGFRYGVALAQTSGRVVLRMADAEVLPFQPGAFASRVAGFAQDLHGLVDTRRRQSNELNQLLESKSYQLAADPTRPLAAPDAPGPVPYLDFAPLDNAVARLQQAAAAYDAAYAQYRADGRRLSGERLRRLNDLLRGLEQSLIDPRGLPGRPWYTHLIYAPGLLTGYGAKTLPGAREAIEQGRWEEADTYIGRTAAALDRYSERLEQAVLELAG